MKLFLFLILAFFGGNSAAKFSKFGLKDLDDSLLVDDSGRRGFYASESSEEDVQDLPRSRKDRLRISETVKIQEPISVEKYSDFEKLVKLPPPIIETPKKLQPLLRNGKVQEASLSSARFRDSSLSEESSSSEENEHPDDTVDEIEEMRSGSFESESIETEDSGESKIYEIRPAQKISENSESEEPEESEESEIRNTERSNFKESGEQKLGEKGNLRTACYKPSAKRLEHRTYPRSWEHAGFEAALPREWDWRNVSGMNYCSPTRNQHIPVYCGSCWVFGSLGALNDRFNVARKNKWPMTFLSPQEIIDCNGKGSCQGGEMSDVYGYAKNHGLVEEGCNNYRAINGKCDPYHRCGTCWPDSCSPITNFTKYYVKDFGSISGRLNMMAEIHNRGPIACAIGATPAFDYNYTGGIYREFGDHSSNHIVSVTGWGVDETTNEEYWIVRNSWGEAWGEKGWFRIVSSLYLNGRGDLYNLGIERDCMFADPDISNLD